MYIDICITEDVIFMLRRNIIVTMLQEVTEQLIIIIITTIFQVFVHILCMSFAYAFSIFQSKKSTPFLLQPAGHLILLRKFSFVVEQTRQIFIV